MLSFILGVKIEANRTYSVQESNIFITACLQNSVQHAAYFLLCFLVCVPSHLWWSRTSRSWRTYIYIYLYTRARARVCVCVCVYVIYVCIWNTSRQCIIYICIFQIISQFYFHLCIFTFMICLLNSYYTLLRYFHYHFLTNTFIRFKLSCYANVFEFISDIEKNLRKNFHLKNSMLQFMIIFFTILWTNCSSSFPINVDEKLINSFNLSFVSLRFFYIFTNFTWYLYNIDIL